MVADEVDTKVPIVNEQGANFCFSVMQSLPSMMNYRYDPSLIAMPSRPKLNKES